MRGFSSMLETASTHSTEAALMCIVLIIIHSRVCFVKKFFLPTIYPQ
jgi:hypothetical protein